MYTDMVQYTQPDPLRCPAARPWRPGANRRALVACGLSIPARCCVEVSAIIATTVANMHKRISDKRRKIGYNTVYNSDKSRYNDNCNQEIPTAPTEGRQAGKETT